MGLVLPDWRLVHPWALHPGRKPRGPVKINPADPLAKYVSHYWLLRGDFKDLMGRADLTAAGTGTTWRSNPRGRYAHTTTSGELEASGLHLPSNRGVTLHVKYTDLVFRAWATPFGFSASASDYFMSHMNGSRQNWAMYGRSPTTNNILYESGVGQSLIADTAEGSATITLSSLTGGGIAKMYVNGQLLGQDTVVTDDFTSALTALGLGGAGAGGGSAWFTEIGIESACVLNIAATDVDVARLHRYPYSVLIPK